ncbi:unnamed protein product [Dibothriocephalus latus]|uniref:Uncharacterized protein n=1 Tax=Dibothriocephalus latus TaxID=60516 RepID=A0A3P7QP78_DIBLA|nr:unnamed protein product [Dibothriocephalus latus]
MTTEFVPRYLPVRYTTAVCPAEDKSWIQTGTPVGLGPPTQSGGTGGRPYRKHHKHHAAEGLTTLSVNTQDSGCFTEFESSAPPTNTLDVEVVSPVGISRCQMKIARAASVDHLRFSASCQVGEVESETTARQADKKENRSPRQLVLGQTRGRRSRTQEGSCMAMPPKGPRLGKKVQVGKPWTELKELPPFSPPPTTEFAVQTLLVDVADSASSPPHDYINLESLRLQPVIQSFDMFTQTELPAEPEDFVVVQEAPIVASAVPIALLESPDSEEMALSQAALRPPPPEYKTAVAQWSPDLTETAVQNSAVVLFDVGTQSEAMAAKSGESKPCQTEEEKEKASSRLASLSCELHFAPPLGTDAKQLYSSPVAVDESDDQHLKFRINFEELQASTLSPRPVRSRTPANDNRRRICSMDEAALQEAKRNDFM